MGRVRLEGLTRLMDTLLVTMGRKCSFSPGLRFPCTYRSTLPRLQFEERRANSFKAFSRLTFSSSCFDSSASPNSLLNRLTVVSSRSIREVAPKKNTVRRDELL